MPAYFSGLDLGQSVDFSALVVLEQDAIPDPDYPGRFLPRFDVRHIHRWPLKTPYPAIVADLCEMFGNAPLYGSDLVVDATGVGAGVVDLIRESRITADVRPFKITCGNNPGDGTVPKVDLVAAVVATLQTGRLRFAADLELTPVLVKELENFRVKVTSDRNETFSAWRESDKDDTVLALALACWYGERHASFPEAERTVRREPLVPAYLGTFSPRLDYPPQGW